MKCPNCKTPDLKPTMIEEYLPAMGCETCLWQPGIAPLLPALGGNTEARAGRADHRRIGGSLGYHCAQ